MGKNGLGQRDEAGEVFLQGLLGMNMVAANTM